MTQKCTYRLPIPSSVGEFVAAFSDAGLCELNFPPGETPSSERGGTGLPSAELKSTPAEIKTWHRLTTIALQRALAGKPSAELPPLDISAGTSFQQRVWRALQRIPLGRTSSYAEVARAIGSPKAVRAVGGACGANPIPVFIPCHRVVSTSGLGGFSGGLDWKRRLLTREGVAL